LRFDELPLARAGVADLHLEAFSGQLFLVFVWKVDAGLRRGWLSLPGNFKLRKSALRTGRV